MGQQLLSGAGREPEPHTFRTHWKGLDHQPASWASRLLLPRARRVWRGLPEAGGSAVLCRPRVPSCPSRSAADRAAEHVAQSSLGLLTAGGSRLVSPASCTCAPASREERCGGISASSHLYSGTQTPPGGLDTRPEKLPVAGSGVLRHGALARARSVATRLWGLGEPYLPGPCP